MTDQELLQQIQNEYQEAFNFFQTRKKRWVQQLVLFSNLGKPDENISTSANYSFFNRVVSSLYDGQMKVTFVPPESTDFKRVEMLNKLAQNDYQEMGLKMVNYDEIWSCAAYSKSYTDTLNYDKKRKVMVPEVISPLYFFSDPFGRQPKTWRYYGFWLNKSKAQLLKMIREKKLDVDNLDGISSGIDPFLWDYKTQEDKAKVVTPNTNDSSSANGTYQLLRWHTVDAETGDKYLVLLDKDIQKILKKVKLDLRDGEDGETNWPIVVKEIFRDPFSTEAISVLDIMEDKTRALNVLYNLMYVAAKLEADPRVAYDKDMVAASDINNMDVSQNIPVDTSGGKTAAQAFAVPSTKPSLSSSIAGFINIIKSEMAESVGTAQISSPVQKNKKSATEAALQQQIADATQSLQALILEAGEQEFWSQWYWRHKRNASKATEKIITLTSVNGVTFETLDLKDVTDTKFPPRVLVQSVKKAEYKKMVMRKSLEQTYAVVTKSMSPKQKRDYDKFIFYPLYEFDQAMLDLVFPPSLDEIKAEQENELLGEDKLAPISPQDDDGTHMFIHLRGKRTPAMWAHWLAHEEQQAAKMAAAQAKEEQAQEKNANGEEQAQVKTPTNGQAAVPVKETAAKQYAAQVPLAPG